MPQSESESHSTVDSPYAGPARFATTHWSVVLAAAGQDIPRQSEALEQLCRAYWYPIYAFIRRRGYSPEDAQDLAQGFFTRLLKQNYPAQADRAKGKFRSFLLLTLNHFLADEFDRANARKRGGGQVFVPLDQEAAEGRYCREPADELTPERLFEQHCGQSVLEEALKRLRAEYGAEDQPQVYAVLKSFEPGAQLTLSYAEAAARLGITESAVKSKVHRLRQRHRELVREVVGETVCTIAEIDEELRHLISVLSG